MLDVRCKDALIKTVEFAIEHGCLGALVRKLAYLDAFGERAYRCVLYGDFAPHSFGFSMEHPDGTACLTGGLIYSGPGQALGGCQPSLTVEIEDGGPSHRWSVHT